mmetsp:Transcript_30101/g.51417  ORF Transcript_30101/g.51417 Transcript_30101/m.51417 type:complete len:88 (+) Transcript_30101:191-454(+)
MMSSSMLRDVVRELCWHTIHAIRPPTTPHGFMDDPSSLLKCSICNVGQSVYILHHDDDEKSTSTAHHATKHPHYCTNIYQLPRIHLR